MKRIIALIAAVLGLTAFAWAQGDSPAACEQCVCAADNTCSSELCHFDEGGCRVVTFTAMCTQYYVRAQIKCSNGSACQSCLSCARVTDLAGNEIRRAHTDCQSGCATYTEGPFALQDGAQYRLEVCLMSCNDGADCAVCSGCVARAHAFAFDCDPAPYCAP